MRESNFKVGDTVNVWNPYGAFYHDGIVEKISPNGEWITVNGQRYKVKDKDWAGIITRWGSACVYAYERREQRNDKTELDS